MTRRACPCGSQGNARGHPPSSPSPPPPQEGAGRTAPPPPPGVTTYDTAYGAMTLVPVPRAVFTAALALEYHHLRDFYTAEGTLRSANDLRARVPRGRTVDTVQTWLRQHKAVLQPLVGTLAPRWRQAPKTWVLGPIQPATTTAVIGGREAKTTRERVVYQRGRAIQITTAMEDVMAVMGWSVVLPVCEQPRQDLPSDCRSIDYW